MSRLVWDATGERFYETGVKNGVLYLQTSGIYNRGYVWNGLTAVTEKPTGAEATALYADDVKYLNLMSNEDFEATIEAYTYPSEFAECDGSVALTTGVMIGQQARKTFGLCYRTTLGNDADGNDYGYKLHIIYGAMASPSEKGYSTINDSPEAITFSWEIKTTPVNVTGYKPTALITIDSTKVNAAKLTALENILYGTPAADARLPLPDEIASLMGGTTEYSVINYLTHVSNSNSSGTTGSDYDAVLTADDGYSIENVIVTMGGVDITDTAYTSGTGAVSVDPVTGPIVIYATANET